MSEYLMWNQLKTRTPKPKSRKDSKMEANKEVNRLNVVQRAALRNWCRENYDWLIGKTLVQVANAFNAQVAEGNPIFEVRRDIHDEFDVIQTETRKYQYVTNWNVRTIAQELGLNTLSNQLVIVKPHVFKELSDNASAAQEVSEAAEPVAATMTKIDARHDLIAGWKNPFEQLRPLAAGIKRREVFVTTDGSQFFTADEAEAYERTVGLSTELFTGLSLVMDVNRVDFLALSRFLLDNYNITKKVK